MSHVLMFAAGTGTIGSWALGMITMVGKIFGSAFALLVALKMSGHYIEDRNGKVFAALIVAIPIAFVIFDPSIATNMLSNTGKNGGG